ncbi:MAG TPA: hypothetical protein VIL49_07040, partial [Capillimicrobium sp.]
MRRLLVLICLAAAIPVAPAAAAPQDATDALAEWLSGQVGPVEEGKKGEKRRPRPGKRPGGAAAPRLAAEAADAPAAAQTLTFQAAGRGPLELVRSFDIPPSDPEYASLANLSWTYDNALAALAFVDRGDRAEAEGLLS